ncbi:hypothetical protein E2C01_055055 [Portunus trituberculatus]|uniref:Uncharacterized protein n=1 Tax=Portunus trituberculatus TaxID=210409 RepID=A0A5B7GTN9_PORTR|nr:hypothetical protein [Portunus trituberculatus]
MFSDSTGKRPRALSPLATLDKDSTLKKAAYHCQCDLLEDSSSNSTKCYPKGQPNLMECNSDCVPLELSLRSNKGQKQQKDSDEKGQLSGLTKLTLSKP